MNLCDYHVNRVHGIPFQKQFDLPDGTRTEFKYWWIAVGYIFDNGEQRRTELMFDTYDEANSVREGFHFLA